MKMEDIRLRRTSSSNCRSSEEIIPSNHRCHRPSSTYSTFGSSSDSVAVPNTAIVRRDFFPVPLPRLSKMRSDFSSFIRSILSIFSLQNFAVPTCRWINIPNHLSIVPSTGRKITGTLFGLRKGHVSFAVQSDPRSEPVLLLELSLSTSALVKEMSSGLVRIALECEKRATAVAPGESARQAKLFQEPVWTMYCNGRKCGYAMSRACSEFDWYVLSTLQSVSVGAGVIPLVENPKSGREGCSGGPEGELLYMRARFERVVGSRDSEAFYMLNPDGNGGPELGIFLLRL
ncbi:hypothetical protein Nepgr_009999 [Nepenthes gracilis]|uniref:Protein MIZU-KUSSEI 1 n=1 Tax=Nepenthes gracilis TaxID=150966 RepID=A0AAD3XKW3_NEPGR|nr:hypothetical protein Nepgr_009999 [Nepenthes gracilis]